MPRLYNIYLLSMIFIASPVGFILHEGGHYVTGLAAQSGPRVIWKRWRGRRVGIRGVTHKQIEGTSSTAIRISGFVPMLWAIITVGSVAGHLLEIGIFGTLSPDVAILSIFIPFWGGVSMSESDVTAMFEPEVFRQRLINDELSGDWGWPVIAEKLF